MASRDFDDEYQLRSQAREHDDYRSGRQSENWGGGDGRPRQSGGYQDRDYRQPQHSQQSDFDRYGGARGNDFGSDYGSGRFGGPGSSGHGGYGGGQAYQDDRSGWNRQQQAFDQGSGLRQTGYGYGGNQFDNEYRNRQQGQYGQYGLRDTPDRQFSDRSFADRDWQGYGDSRDRLLGGLRDDSDRSTGGRFYQERQHTAHDPDYQQWRNQQLRDLDNDYQTWRGERYQKFSDEFNTWRSNRVRDEKTSQGGSQRNTTNGDSSAGAQNANLHAKSKDQGK